MRGVSELSTTVSPAPAAGGADAEKHAGTIGAIRPMGLMMIHVQPTRCGTLTPGQAQLQKAVNQEAAERLTTEGMPVRVTLENNDEIAGRLKMRPKRLPGGTWVCAVVGMAKLLDCSRVAPAVGGVL